MSTELVETIQQLIEATNKHEGDIECTGRDINAIRNAIKGLYTAFFGLVIMDALIVILFVAMIIVSSKVGIWNW